MEVKNSAFMHTRLAPCVGMHVSLLPSCSRVCQAENSELYAGENPHIESHSHEIFTRGMIVNTSELSVIQTTHCSTCAIDPLLLIYTYKGPLSVST